MFSLLVATSFVAPFGKLVHKLAPTLWMLKESTPHKHSFLTFNGSAL